MHVLLLVDQLNRLCLARADSWTYEVRRSVWRTLAEAVPELRKVEAETEPTRR